MRAWIGAIGLLALVACGEEPPCGVDDDGNDVPYCEVPAAGEEEPLAYCPLEHWGAADGCNTCGCTDGGEIVCTDLRCGQTTTDTNPGTTNTGTSGTGDTGQ